MIEYFVRNGRLMSSPKTLIAFTKIYPGAEIDRNTGITSQSNDQALIMSTVFH